MKDEKELSSKQLSNVSGGDVALDKYLKELAEKDKQQTLKDNDDGREIVLNPNFPLEDN